MIISIVPHRRFWFIFSGVLIVLSMVAICVFGLKFGIDFTGGSLLEIQITQLTDTGSVRNTLGDLGFSAASVQQSGETGYIIRTQTLTEDDHQKILIGLKEIFGSVVELRFDSIGPIIGKELKKTATIGVIMTLILIGLYVALAYRKVSHPISAWKYGALTVFTAFHDVIVTVGAFAVLGEVYGWEIGSAFVAAILTILGYSINDTVVVFDRTRENLLKGTGESFDMIVEKSIHQTFMRSMSTTLTTLFALLAVFILGGDTTRPFALALMIGIAVGAYSSIFVASPALVSWEMRNRGQ